MTLDFKRFYIAYSMRFVRSVILATAFLYGFIGIVRCLANDGMGLDICILRISIVIFILSIYAITYTEMFIENYQYIIAGYVIVNSAVLVTMGVISQGMESLMADPLSLLPAAVIMLVLNYILPLSYKTAIISGFVVSIPYLVVSICGGSVNYILTTVMVLLVINVLLSLNSYSNEKMITELWGYRTN